MDKKYRIIKGDVDDVGLITEKHNYPTFEYQKILKMT